MQTDTDTFLHIFASSLMVQISYLYSLYSVEYTSGISFLNEEAH